MILRVLWASENWRQFVALFRKRVFNICVSQFYFISRKIAIFMVFARRDTFLLLFAGFAYSGVCSTHNRSQLIEFWIFEIVFTCAYLTNVLRFIAVLFLLLVYSLLNILMKVSRTRF